MKVRLYANPEELNEYLNGGRNTFKASYDRVTPEQTLIEVETTQATLTEDAVENLDVTPNSMDAIEVL